MSEAVSARFRSIDGGRIVPGKEACLQLSDPVPTLDRRQCRVIRQMALESKLIKLSIVKGAELLRQAAKGSDKPELGADVVNDKIEPRLSANSRPRSA